MKKILYMTTNHVDVEKCKIFKKNNFVAKWKQNEMQKIISNDYRVLKLIRAEARKLIPHKNSHTIRVYITQFYQDNGVNKQIREGVELEIKNNYQLFDFDIDIFTHKLNAVIMNYGNNKNTHTETETVTDKIDDTQTKALNSNDEDSSGNLVNIKKNINEKDGTTVEVETGDGKVIEVVMPPKEPFSIETDKNKRVFGILTMVDSRNLFSRVLLENNKFNFRKIEIKLTFSNRFLYALKKHHLNDARLDMRVKMIREISGENHEKIISCVLIEIVNDASFLKFNDDHRV